MISRIADRADGRIVKDVPGTDVAFDIRRNDRKIEVVNNRPIYEMVVWFKDAVESGANDSLVEWIKSVAWLISNSIKEGVGWIAQALVMMVQVLSQFYAAQWTVGLASRNRPPVANASTSGSAFTVTAAPSK